MSWCPLENGCLDSWTWTDGPDRCLVTNDIDVVFARTSFAMQGFSHRTFLGTKVLNSDAHYWEVQLNHIVLSIGVYVSVYGRGKSLAPDRELVSRDGQEKHQKHKKWGLSSKGHLYSEHHAFVQGTYSQPYSQPFPLWILMIGSRCVSHAFPQTSTQYIEGLELKRTISIFF